MGLKSRRLDALGLAAGTVVAGIVWRMAPLHLPGFALKYGRSALYGAMLYWLGVAMAPRARSWKVGLGAMAAAFAIESFKLWHTPGLDAFRLTLAGKLMLGRVFTVGALLAYALAIGLIALGDFYQRKDRSRLE